MANDIPTVTIGMPVYNREKTLRQALDSLLAQTFTNFELVISDNASTDGTEAICRQYAAEDKRIRYVRAETNRGMHWNFNKVLELACGEYFMWAASDDRWANDFISSLLNALQADQDAIGAFPPYQFVEAETGKNVEGIRRFGYEDRHAFLRLLKYTWHYDDAHIYALLRRKHIKEIHFQPWVWINAETPYNMAYPALYFLLARGNILSVGERPLWFNTVRISQWHSTPFKSNPILAYLLHIVRKINLLLRSTRHIYWGSRSILLAAAFVPVLFMRLLIDCVTPAYAACHILLSGKKLSQVSPHEIWKLGVR